MNLTEKQLETLRAIGTMEQTLGRFPTLRELTVQLGLKSHISTYDRLLGLREKGFLDYQKLDNRNESPFKLTDQAKRFIHWVDYQYSSSGSSTSAQFTQPNNQPTATDDSLGHKQDVDNIKIHFPNAFADTAIAFSTVKPESFLVACALTSVVAASVLHSWNYSEVVVAIGGIYLISKKT